MENYRRRSETSETKLGSNAVHALDFLRNFLICFLIGVCNVFNRFYLFDYELDDACEAKLR